MYNTPGSVCSPVVQAQSGGFNIAYRTNSISPYSRSGPSEKNMLSRIAACWSLREHARKRENSIIFFHQLRTMTRTIDLCYRKFTGRLRPAIASCKLSTPVAGLLHNSRLLPEMYVHLMFRERMGNICFHKFCLREKSGAG